MTGVPAALLPILWAALHVVKALASLPGGALSDRWGRGRVLGLGWLLYAAVYAGFAVVSSAVALWALTLTYGLYFGLTEGVERALIADLAHPARRATAYGWYHLAIGVAALPSSLLMGTLWQAFGPGVAFATGAAFALLAAALLPLGLRAPRSDPGDSPGLV